MLKQQVDFLRQWLPGEYRTWLEDELEKVTMDHHEATISAWEKRVKSWEKPMDKVAIIPCHELHKVVNTARQLFNKVRETI